MRYSVKTCENTLTETNRQNENELWSTTLLSTGHPVRTCNTALKNPATTLALDVYIAQMLLNPATTLALDVYIAQMLLTKVKRRPEIL
jgi:hypothetical protein